MFSFNMAVYNIFGGYTPEVDSVDRDNENITYELKSIIPDNDALDEILEIAAKLQNEIHR